MQALRLRRQVTGLEKIIYAICKCVREKYMCAHMYTELSSNISQDFVFNM